MTLSIKKIFQKKEAQATQEKKPSSTDKVAEQKSNEGKSKHDTPTGCCGSCS
ncbi:CCGSCS motif protein [Vibrio methylphosphonaticus]|uniref:CCGSCS motif protein n=1 Tax=Vibrio methylphosphonaticus TaxID=2946866 RepID=UPI00202A9EEC|nr:CCGSCS motif protein [Vibrio methylphosphonaticus]MCL9777476.1 CCGSCS motif protein [Vibrio methylphosphonaticus]